MIQVSGLKKSFGDLEVLKGIDINIEHKNIMGLAGVSGTGKSTLLRCINGLESYDDGSLVVDGIEISHLSDKELRGFRKNIGMIFQHFSLLNRLTVYENIALPMRCWKYDKKHIDRTVKELLEIIGIPEKSNSKTRELSGGQKQRVAIARALTMDPKVLLCDEATSALDPKNTKSVLKVLKDINDKLGITIIVVAHQMAVLRRICREIAILEDGVIKASGTVDRIFLEQPQALQNLMGERDYMLPETGHNYEILISPENAFDPIITRMARELNVDFAIVGGEMESFQGNPLGSVIINVDDIHREKTEQFFSRNNVSWRQVIKTNFEYVEAE